MESDLGIKRWTVDVSTDSWIDAVRVISEGQGYTTIADPEKPEPEISPEHCHSGDEVRLILEGSAFFIVRVGESEEFVTIPFSAGEMISMPAGIWHRLGPGEGSYRSVRFFHDKATWGKTLRN